MADVKLSPETLLAQSEQMTSLMNEFDSLFNQVKSNMTTMNGCWSENLAKNFEGKMTSAQKSFSSVLNMFANGSAAARVASESFSSGTSLNSILSGLMGGDSAFDSSSVITQWLAGANLTDEESVRVASALGLDFSGSSAVEVLEQIKDGDYAGAVKTFGNEVIDMAVDGMSLGLVEGSWVESLEEATGGTLSLATLEQDYYKNLFGENWDLATDIVSNQLSGSSDPVEQAKLLGEMAWNSTAGALLDTGFDAAFDVVSNIPVLGDWYAEQGVTDGEGALGLLGGSISGEIMYAMTGDDSAREACQNYYTEHGGVARGIVDGVAEIGSYLWESIVGK